jgi:glutamate synthase (ferredoxin)
LGKTGRNFAAGMSGGIAYVFDPDGTFSRSCNTEMVRLETLSNPEEMLVVQNLIEKHFRYTESPSAALILTDFSRNAEFFVRVVPTEYEQMLLAIHKAKASGHVGEDAVMAAFEERYLAGAKGVDSPPVAPEKKRSREEKVNG